MSPPNCLNPRLQSRAGLVTRFQSFSSLVGNLACFAYLSLTWKRYDAIKIGLGIVSGLWRV